MNDIAERLTKTERDQSHPNLKPRDAATLILVDRSGPDARRCCSAGGTPASNSWPGKFVFPGGRMEPGDKRMPVASELDTHAERAADARRAAAEPRQGARRWRLPRSARLTRRPASCSASGSTTCRRSPDGPWKAFAEAKVLPDLAEMHFIVRAITPPRPSAPVRHPLLRRRRKRDRAQGRGRGRAGQRAGRAGLAPDRGGEQPGSADDHASGAATSCEARVAQGIRARPALRLSIGCCTGNSSANVL